MSSAATTQELQRDYLDALLAGSGPTLFALTTDRAVAQEIGARLRRPGWTVILTRLAGRLDPSGAAEGSGLLP